MPIAYAGFTMEPMEPGLQAPRLEGPRASDFHIYKKFLIDLDIYIIDQNVFDRLKWFFHILSIYSFSIFLSLSLSLFLSLFLFYFTSFFAVSNIENACLFYWVHFHFLIEKNKNWLSIHVYLVLRKGPRTPAGLEALHAR